MSELQYTVRRSARARRPRVVVEPGGVEVVLPGRMSLECVPPLVAEKRQWIERTLGRFREAQAKLGVRLEDGGCVPYLGRRLDLVVRVEAERLRPLVRRRGPTLEVALGRPGPEELGQAVERWYRRRARAELGPRLDAAAARAGSNYRRLEIRGQRTRWASCSSTGTMSFNWRLLLAPEPVLDYVVEHEVAHLEVADHSPRFWELLATRCPEYRDHARWLRRHGAALRL